MTEAAAPTAAMIFAAGFGTRMGTLTARCPKPLIRVAGQNLLDRALDLAWAEVDRVTVNAHYHADQIAAHLRNSAAQISVEHPDILDTGGGLRAALPTLGPGPVFSLNPDVVWTGPNPLTELRAKWPTSGIKSLLLLIPAKNAWGRMGDGDFSMASDGRISRGGDLIYSGAQIIRTDGLDQMPDGAFSLNLLWDDLIATQELFGMVHTGGWCDVGYPEAIPMAERMLADG